MMKPIGLLLLTYFCFAQNLWAGGGLSTCRGNINLLDVPYSYDFREEWAAVVKEHQRCAKKGELENFVKNIPNMFYEFKPTVSISLNDPCKIEPAVKNGGWAR